MGIEVVEISHDFLFVFRNFNNVALYSEANDTNYNFRLLSADARKVRTESP